MAAIKPSYQPLWNFYISDFVPSKFIDDPFLKMEKNDFWDDPIHSKGVIERANTLKSWTVKYEEAKERIESIDSIYPEIASLSDDDLLEESKLELNRIEALLEDLEIRKMLSGFCRNGNRRG